MTLQAVLFDLDGTLLDTAPDLANALNRLREDRGQTALTQAAVRKVVSNGANAMLTLAFQQSPGDPDFEELRAQLLAYYLENLASHTRPFEGIERLIEQLHAAGIAWGVVTNKPWPYTQPLMMQFSFASPPAVIICPEHVSHRKPAPDALLLACEQLQCEVNRAIYVGDHQRDILCGKHAGMDTIAVGYGYIDDNDSHLNWGAEHSVTKAEEIWPIIEAYLP